MADIENRRQQYWEGQRKKASDADPGGLKLALQLLSLLPMSEENKAVGADWLTRNHKAGVVPDNRPIIEEGATQAGLLASYLVPPVGIPLNMAYEVDRLENEREAGMEGNAAPLALSMLPMGGTARAATKGGRLAKGLEGMLAPVAVGGGSMLMSDMASAGQAGEAGPASGDTDQQAVQFRQQLEEVSAELTKAKADRDAEEATGKGTNYNKAVARVDALEKRQATLTEQMQKHGLDMREQAAGHSNRIGMGAAGLGAGALLSLVPTMLSRGQAARKVSSFKGAADDLAAMMPAGEQRVVGTPTGDRMTALVNEAYKDAGASMPFLRGRGAPVARPPEAARSYSPLAMQYRQAPAGDEALFANAGKAPGDVAIPVGLTIEGVGASAAGSGAFGDLSPEARRNWEDAGAAGLGAALGYKGGRFAGKVGVPAPDAKSRAAVTAARSRLERETQDLESPTLWGSMTGGLRDRFLPAGAKSTKQLPGPTGSQTSAPPSNPAPVPQGPQALPPPDVLPGSLAPELGAKKVKQPRPKKDAQGRWRKLGEFSKPPERKRKTPEGTK